ncbi:glycosyl transferase [Massilia sp. Dwa41.01b]|uniref:MraY family glycosyltransferase n=1 Tax=unclassified Massilia TaxID=2609279 RepID=UPI001600C150|nr:MULTISPECIES: glycosyltransferase [unclassified Massilia]QNA90111.1 glycosyl transferase [Massilia sp. Dwa41.01b]QNB01000.1 glycosyl transferase [Massilia sp. Se16.2.3]
MDLQETHIFVFELGFAVSLLCSLLLVATTRWHGRFTLDATAGVQKFHSVPTPRIGGLAIMLGLICAYAVAGTRQQDLLAPLLAAAAPAFLFGIAEDMTRRVSIGARLLATMASGLACWAFTGVSIVHTGLDLLDLALTWLPLSILFTAFAVGGVANAVNIIDGFNGLASGTVVIGLAALGVIALDCGDTELAWVCFTVCIVTAGFFLVNFPFGKLFLGDGGAYLLGFLLAWLSVMLVYRNREVSAWAALLACAYPTFETLFTIVRRVWCGRHPGQPDRCHLHSLVKIAIAGRLFRKLRAPLRNACVSPFCWLLAAVPAMLAVRFHQDSQALVLAALASLGIYLAFYWYVAYAARARRRRAQRPQARTTAIAAVAAAVEPEAASLQA